jgi:hypothetical protein
MGSSLRPVQTSPHARNRTGGASNLIGDGVASAWRTWVLRGLSFDEQDRQQERRVRRAL